MTRKLFDTKQDSHELGDVAFEWLCRIRNDKCTKAEHQAFRLWLQEPENAGAFKQAEEFKSALSAISSRPAISSLRQRILNNSEARLAQKMSAVAKGVDEVRVKANTNIISLSSERRSSGAEATNQRSNHAGYAAQAKRFGTWSKLVGGLSVAAAAAFFAFMPIFKNTHHTGVGEIRTIVLEDQTKITLDTDTKIRVAYSSSERRVYLKNGQAFFDVAKNPNRPFMVDTGVEQVIAVGTAFSVRSVDADFTVMLSEGIVDIATGEKSSFETKDRVRLEPGQQWHAGNSSKGIKTTVEDINAQLGWMDGTLVFRSAPLDNVLREVNRYSDVKVNVKNGDLAKNEIDAVYHIGKTESFAIAVRKMLNLELTYDHQGNISLETIKQ